MKVVFCLLAVVVTAVVGLMPGGWSDALTPDDEVNTIAEQVCIFFGKSCMCY